MEASALERTGEKRKGKGDKSGSNPRSDDICVRVHRENLNLCQADAKGACNRINQILKTKVPDDEKTIPIWQKGMEKWYRDRIEKDPGLDLGHGVKLKGDLSIKDKQATISVCGKF